MTTLQTVKFLRFTVPVVTDIRIILAKLTLGVLGLPQNVKAIYEYLRVISGKQVCPLLIPPDELRGVLANIKNDMRRKSQTTAARGPQC